MAQGQTEVVGESFAGPVSLVEDCSVPLLAMASAHILFGDTTVAPKRRLDIESETRDAQPASLLPVGTLLS